MTSNSSPAGIRRLIYYEVLDGDKLKAAAESNFDRSSGGGARDIRLPVQFNGVLTEMFPEAGTGRGNVDINIGSLVWGAGGKKTSRSEIELWPPTDSRSTELRISKINTLPPFSEIPADDTEHLFLVLVQDDVGDLRAHFVPIEILRSEAFYDRLVESIENCIGATDPRKRVMGYIDFDLESEYCHE